MTGLSDEQLKSIKQKQQPKIEIPKTRFKINPPKIPKDLIISQEQALSIIERDAKKITDESDHPYTTTYFGFPLLQEHSPKVMCRKILSHNQFKKFTAVSSIGKSGAGKSTVSEGLVHHLHALGESEYGIIYHVRWVGKEELVDFDQFLKSCAHVNTIFVFEDISYALELVKKVQKIKIKEAFTHIRHELKDVNVICIFHYHYTRALDKMMRDSYYTIYTSLGHEEKGNILHIHGSDQETKEMLNKFQYRSRTQDEDGYFTIPLDRENENLRYIYWTQNPFQIALTNQHDKWHFMLYASPKIIPELSCHHCAPKPDKYDANINARYLIETMQKHFGKQRANLILRWYCFMKGGRDCLNKYDRKVWVWLENFLQDHPINLDSVIPQVQGEIRWGKIKRLKTDNFRSLNKKEAEKITKDVLSKHEPYTEKKISDTMAVMFDS